MSCNIKSRTSKQQVHSGLSECRRNELLQVERKVFWPTRSSHSRRLPFRIRSLQGHPFLYLFLFGELTARRGSVFNIAILFKWHINSLLSLLSLQVTGFGRFGKNVLTYHTTEAS
ncbi:hypothetical protein T01_9090 [Trichinella spiralis]|uniref:Uncharacterized protein n=1 Tax=Trichinella spiralis TaxID=6334 RepID=A0A0V1AU43_TRISP|nr:hypothetical protein T01_9090 [Trichinella spiralis]